MSRPASQGSRAKRWQRRTDIDAAHRINVRRIIAREMRETYRELRRRGASPTLARCRVRGFRHVVDMASPLSAVRVPLDARVEGA